MAGPKEWLTEIDKVRLPYNIGVLSQVSAQFSIVHKDWFGDQAEKICVERLRVEKTLKEFPGLNVYPSMANFILFQLRDGKDRSVFDSLLRNDVMIKNLDGHHPALKGCLRVTVSTPDENDIFFDALSTAISR